MRLIVDNWAAFLLAWFLLGCAIAPMLGLFFRASEDRPREGQPDRLGRKVERAGIHSQGITHVAR